MKNLVPKLSTCRKLKEAGWEKKTCFDWWKTQEIGAGYTLVEKGWDVVPSGDKLFGEFSRCCVPAPLTDELLGELPEEIKVKIPKEDRHYFWDVNNWEQKEVSAFLVIRGRWEIYYYSVPTEEDCIHGEEYEYENSYIKNKSLPEALAQLTLFLYKEKLL